MFDVWDRITELRNSRGWTNYRIAKEAGIPQSTLQTWLAKEMAPPIEAVEKICDVFDITLSEFFYDKKQESEESKISKIRKEKGITVDELAFKSDISAEYISAFEQKKMNIMNASYSMVKRMADALECSPDDIVEDINA